MVARIKDTCCAGNAMASNVTARLSMDLRILPRASVTSAVSKAHRLFATALSPTLGRLFWIPTANANKPEMPPSTALSAHRVKMAPRSSARANVNALMLQTLKIRRICHVSAAEPSNVRLPHRLLVFQLTLACAFKAPDQAWAACAPTPYTAPRPCSRWMPTNVHALTTRKCLNIKTASVACQPTTRHSSFLTSNARVEFKGHPCRLAPASTPQLA